MNVLAVILGCVCLVLVIIVAQTYYYIPWGTIVYMSKVSCAEMLDDISAVYVIKTPLVEHLMSFCGNVASHWGTLIETVNGYHYILSSSKTNNVYVYRVPDEVIHDYIIEAHQKSPKWLVCEKYIPMTNDVTVNDYLICMHDYVSNMIYIQNNHNCHYVTKYCIERMCVGSSPDIVNGSDMYSNIFMEYLTGDNLMGPVGVL